MISAMKIRSLVISASLVGAHLSQAAILVSDNFDDGVLSGPLNWSVGAFNGGGNTNLATGVGSNPVVLGDGRGQLVASYPSTPNVGYSGTQIAANTVSSTLFNGYQLSQITIQFDAGIVSDKPGSPRPVLFEIRQANYASDGNGATHRFYFTPVDNIGTMSNYSFTLDTNLYGPNFLTNFDTTNTKAFVFQVQPGNYATTGTPTTTTFQIDNFIVTAVPEPGSLMLGAIGLCVAASRRRR